MIMIGNNQGVVGMIQVQSVRMHDLLSFVYYSTAVQYYSTTKYYKTEEQIPPGGRLLLWTGQQQGEEIDPSKRRSVQKDGRRGMPSLWCCTSLRTILHSYLDNT